MSSFKDIQKELQASERTEPAARDDFWQVFRARAAQRRQEPARAPTFLREHSSGLRWATATASLALLCGLAFLYLRPTNAFAFDTVQSINVSVPHESIYIMSGNDSDATIIWIEGI